MNQNSPDFFVVLIPVYNDWESLSMLIPHLDRMVEANGIKMRLLLVDDGSEELGQEGLSTLPLAAIEGIAILRLRRNLGHQRAIAIGLCHIEETIPCRGVVIMDGDGEDSPNDIPKLLERFTDEHDRKVIFAERARRSESLTFKIFYSLFKLLHFVFVGEKVRVGNFSIIPSALLSRLVVVSDLWNHYAASVFKARLPKGMVPLNRAQRLSGKSQMNFVQLVVHGLCAMSVYGDRIGVRLLISISVAQPMHHQLHENHK